MLPNIVQQSPRLGCENHHRTKSFRRSTRFYPSLLPTAVSPFTATRSLLIPKLPCSTLLPPPSPAATTNHPTKWLATRGTPLLWLGLYMALNLVLTLFNKSVLSFFPFPYTLSALHALCASIGSLWLKSQRNYPPRSFSLSENAVLAAFSLLYTVNIVVSNVSLQLVTVPLHQVIRASTPLFIIIISRLCFGTVCSHAKALSLLPVIAGVALATQGDYFCTLWGIMLTLLGTVLAAAKTILSHIIQNTLPHAPPTPSLQNSNRVRISQRSRPNLRLQLSPLDLLIRMSPLAFIQCIIYSYSTGELQKVLSSATASMNLRTIMALATNGVIAFGLNIVSFTANKKVGALSMTVAANIKQVLTVLLAVFMFNLTVTWTNAAGIVLTLIGGAWYAAVEFNEKKRG